MNLLSYSTVFVFALHLRTFSYCYIVNREILNVSSITCHINSTITEGIDFPFLYQHDFQMKIK